MNLNHNHFPMQGIEKKRSSLHESEKGVVARHEAGHAVVGTAVASLLLGHARVEVYYDPLKIVHFNS